MYSFPNFEPVRCFMSDSKCCFLTCIQISQEVGKVVWYFHLFKNFPQFVVIHRVKGFSVVNETELDVFLDGYIYIIITGKYIPRIIYNYVYENMDFPGVSVSKESACNAGNLSSITGLGRSPAEENIYPLQYSCLENSMERGSWRATIHWVTKKQT